LEIPERARLLAFQGAGLRPLLLRLAAQRLQLLALRGLEAVLLGERAGRGGAERRDDRAHERARERPREPAGPRAAAGRSRGAGPLHGPPTSQWSAGSS